MSNVPVPDVHPDVEGPSDNTTVTEVLEHYVRGGFDGGFTAEEGGSVRCHACDAVTPAARTSMHSLRRLEGASDPADMVAVVALTCPQCGSKGTMTLGFGAMASAEDSDVLSALRDRRSDDQAPPSSAPGEAAATS